MVGAGPFAEQGKPGEGTSEAVEIVLREKLPSSETTNPGVP